MTNTQQTTQEYKAQLTTMLGQSMAVMTEHTPAAFDRFKHHGGVRQAALYVALAAAVAALMQLLFGMMLHLNMLVALLTPVLIIPLQFFTFTGLVYWISKNMFNSTATFDEISYSFSLFVVPLSILGSVLTLVPVLGLLTVLPIAAANIYYGSLAARATLKLPQSGNIWTVLLLAILGQMLVGGLVGGVLGALAFASIMAHAN